MSKVVNELAAEFGAQPAAAHSAPERALLHGLETRVGAIVLPAAEANAALRSLPPNALRDGRNCTPFLSAAGGPPRVALHVSHAVAVALSEEGLGAAAALLGEAVAAQLQAGTATWQPCLRPLSACCRVAAEEDVFVGWRRRDEEAAVAARFRFVELFAGIGGFRLGLEPLGGACVLAAEIDDGARAVYRENFDEECATDVLALDAADLPPHDVLTAGFPCQPYAQCNTDNMLLTGSLKAGLGLRERRGVLAFEIVRLLRAACPRVCLLENVPNLSDFNGGEDLAQLLEALRGIGYVVQTRILDARHFGVPQQRKRLYFIGFRADLPAEAIDAFRWPDAVSPEAGRLPPPRLASVLEPEEDVPASCRLSATAWASILEAQPDAERPSGLGGHMARLDGYARTLCSTYRTRGAGATSELVPPMRLPKVEVSNASVPAGHHVATPRFFTRRECCRLMGFPDDFVLESPARRCKDPERFYHFIGNAVVPPVIRSLGKAILQVLDIVDAKSAPADSFAFLDTPAASGVACAESTGPEAAKGKDSAGRAA